MCGILGVVFESDLGRMDIQAALKSILHRGPDFSHYLAGEDYALGHNRLSILDLSSAASQPMSDSLGSVTIVYNGEIYNHAMLREQLEIKGCKFTTRSDTEVILHGYLAWGESVFERLEGMFAIGIYDRRLEQLILVRDRSGEKPLFYASKGESLCFASEIKAIVRSGFISPSFDSKKLSFLLTFGYVPAPYTLYDGIQQLPPASVLKLKRGQLPKVQCYWQTPLARVKKSNQSVEEVKREVRRLIDLAVTARLEADVPLGAFLSGGIDSSIIVALMSQKLGKQLQTFSIGFSGDSRFDETFYARLVAKKFDTEHTEYILTPASFELIEKLVEHHDGPFGDSSAIPTYMVSKLARQSVTVALTGDGGDELFCGYPRFIAGKWTEFVPEWMRMVSARHFGSLAEGSRGLLGRLKRFVAISGLPLPQRMSAWTSYFHRLDAILKPEILSKMSVDDPRIWSCGLLSDTDSQDVLGQILAHNFKSYLPCDLLVKADRSSMAQGLELRSPFLDTKLIEYAATIPASMLHHGYDTKWILKQAFSDLLPQAILTREKMGFGMPLAAWFREDLSGYLQDYLIAGSPLIYAYLNKSYVEALVNQHIARSYDHSSSLWLLLTLEIWLRNLK
ncbi:MAG: asparagine synthase (glutamine-hydrolyzing) [Myxococcaceae bacterium]|nr:asparagine synthase (glutamine-hydrolyzing) [Myxococcaceae bacterium]MBH2006789.1 asparagine synthase (glutamine-hydrolyzing) [Myxococcaceae bacterium]